VAVLPYMKNCSCWLAAFVLYLSIGAATELTVVPKEMEWRQVDSSQRWEIYRERTYASPGAYFRAFTGAGLDQLNDRPPSWPQGLEGYSRRVGQRFVTFTMQSSAEAGLSAAAGYDPRYVRCKCIGMGSRIGHAFKMNFVVMNSQGKQVFDWPKFVSAYGVGMLSTTWVDDYKWSAQGLRAGNSQFYFGGLFNVVREFGPEIKRVFRRK